MSSQPLHGLTWSHTLDSLLRHDGFSTPALRRLLCLTVWQQHWNSCLRDLYSNEETLSHCQIALFGDENPDEESDDVWSEFNASHSDNASEHSFGAGEPSSDSTDLTGDIIIWDRHRENIHLERRLGFAGFAEAVATRHCKGYAALRERVLALSSSTDVFWDGDVDAYACEAVPVPLKYPLKSRRPSLGPVQRGLDTLAASEGSEAPVKVRREVPRRTIPTTSRTCFGRLHVTPFPFAAVMHFDDCEDTVVFTLESSLLAPDTHEMGAFMRVRRTEDENLTEIERLLELNTESEQVRRWRTTRSKLRALDGQKVRANGRQGHLHVRQSSNQSSSAGGAAGEPSLSPSLSTGRSSSLRGFECTVELRPSRWFLPRFRFMSCATRTQHMRVQDFEEHVHLHFGHPAHFDEENSSLVREICQQANPKHVQAIEKAKEQLRRETIVQFEFREGVLPYRFHTEVFCQPMSSYQELKAVLKKYDKPCPLLPFFEHHLAERVQFRQCCRVVSYLEETSSSQLFWWAFWFDLYHSNPQLSKASSPKILETFDPNHLSSIAYRPDMSSLERIQEFFQNKGLSAIEQRLLAFLPIDLLLRQTKRLERCREVSQSERENMSSCPEQKAPPNLYFTSAHQ